MTLVKKCESGAASLLNLLVTKHLVFLKQILLSTNHPIGHTQKYYKVKIFRKKWTWNLDKHVTLIRHDIKAVYAEEELVWGNKVSYQGLRYKAMLPVRKCLCAHMTGGDKYWFEMHQAWKKGLILLDWLPKNF